MEEPDAESRAETLPMLAAGALGALGLLVPGPLMFRLWVTGTLLPLCWVCWGIARRKYPFTAELLTLFAGIAWLKLWVLLFPFSLMFRHSELVIALVAGLAPIPLFVRSRPVYLMTLVYALMIPQILMLGMAGTDAETQLAITVALSLFAWSYSGRCWEACGFRRPAATDSWMAVLFGGVTVYSILTKHITEQQGGFHLFSPALLSVWIAVPVMVYLLFYRSAPKGRRELPSLMSVLFVPALYLLPSSAAEDMTLTALLCWTVLAGSWVVLGNSRCRWGWMILGLSVFFAVVLEFVNSRLREEACLCDIRSLDNFWLAWLLLGLAAAVTVLWWRLGHKGRCLPVPLPSDCGVPQVPIAGNGLFVIVWGILQILTLLAAVCLY